MSNNSSLKSKTRKGFFWSSFEKLSTQGLQFIFSIILARILSPEDYGIIAMPMIFLQIAQVFIDSGFNNAIIRRQDLSEKDLSTAFIFNIGVGVIFYIILFISSPFIAKFYNTPILSSVLKVSALATLFTPLCTVQQAILTIKLDFRKQAIISLVAQIATGIVGIAMAYGGYGVWSLVISQAAASLLRTIMLWVMSNWYPRTGWSNESFKYLWSFGSRLLGVGLLDCIYQNIYTVVIGKFYSKQDLGLYTRSYGFAKLPTNFYYSVIKRVSFPILSSVQDDSNRMMQIFKKMFVCTTFIIFPLMFCMAGMATPLVSVVLSDKWLPMVPYFQILCIAVIWIPLDSLNLNLLTIKGRSDLFLRLEIIKKTIGAIILIATLKSGITFLCIGYAVYCILEVMIDTYYTGIFFKYGLLKQLRDIISILILSVLLLLVNLHIVSIVKLTAGYQLILCIIGSIFIFLLYSFLFLRDTSIETVKFVILK